MCKELFKGARDTVCFDSLGGVGRKHRQTHEYIICTMKRSRERRLEPGG